MTPPGCSDKVPSVQPDPVPGGWLRGCGRRHSTGTDELGALWRRCSGSLHLRAPTKDVISQSTLAPHVSIFHRR